MSFNAAEIKDRLVQWIRDWFEKNGKDCLCIQIAEEREMKEDEIKAAEEDEKREK